MLPMGIGSSLCLENKTTNDIVSGYREQVNRGEKLNLSFSPRFLFYFFFAGFTTSLPYIS